MVVKTKGRILIFGAGKVGRSLIGQIFSNSGYEVVFVDVDDVIINALNSKRRYQVEVKDRLTKTIWVENVRAVHGEDLVNVALEVATSDVIATVVGVNNLPYIYGNIARGLLKRRDMKGGPIDIIIFENLRDSSSLFREGLKRYLPDDYPFESLVGLVETSTDKMVPDMPKELRLRDPLLIFAESYNTVIVDRKAFKTKIPEVQGLKARENIHAYFDRKFFTLNLGHAIIAYLGYLMDRVHIWEAINNEQIRNTVEGAMWESGRALIAEYPKEFNEEIHGKYVFNLINRLGNRALGDTVYRVGRDLPRKLSYNDRLVGTLRLGAKHGFQAPNTVLGIAAAMFFRGRDENGELFKEDRYFVDELYPKGIDYILEEICGLHPEIDQENSLIEEIKKAYTFLYDNPGNWFLYLQQNYG